VRDLRFAVSGLVVAAAVLTGCSEKQEASTTLPPTSAAETTEALPQLGPADFPVPDEARTKDAAGAKAFLGYYIDLLNHQRPLLDGDPLLDLGPNCATCARIADNYQEAAAVGHRYEGGELSLNDIAEPVLTEDRASLVFGIRQEAVRIVDKTGNIVNPGLPTNPNLGSGMTLAWSEDDEGWLVEGMTLG
jgi:hypothetical protein